MRVKFNIEAQPVFSYLKIVLDAGESLKAEAGAMISMTPSIDLKAKTSGKGVLGAIKSMVGGESLFSSIYTATENGSELVLGPGGPGDILHLQLNGETVFAQSGAYLAGSADLDLSTQGSLRAMVSGEGLFLQKITGTGHVFLSSYGAVIKKDLAAGEEYNVDSGNMVAFTQNASYTIRKAAKGIFASLASGEGLVCRFKGPGSVWIQTRSMSGLAQLLQPYFNKPR